MAQEFIAGVLPRFLEEPIFNRLCAQLGLSQREREIVRHIFRDCKEAAIAHDLAMSPHTLRTHVERLYRKLKVTTRTGLVVRLYESYLALTCEAGSALPPLCGVRAFGGCPLRR